MNAKPNEPGTGSANTAVAKTPPSMHILFADDEPSLQQLMHKNLTRMGHRVTVCPDGATAVAAMEKESFDCLIVDYNMPGYNGIEVIEQAATLQPDAETLIMTAAAVDDSPLRAIQNGVFDFLIKPTPMTDLRRILNRVARCRADKKLLRAYEQRLRHQSGGAKLVGTGEAMDRVRRLIGKVGPTDATVLIRGETGCGKELVAAEIHRHSLRGDAPMVPINCGALPEQLIESELFGHCRGAFTGADKARQGLFEVADGGTLFLDEIGELPLAMQAKLLRVLETGDIRRLGDNHTTQVDVRIVCATHRDLEAMVAEGTFREDLMFRINTFEVHVPPLRNRTEDIATLANHLLRRFRVDLNDDDQSCNFTDEATEKLMTHAWPGNVRELANVIEHAAILCDRLPIEADDLPAQFGRRKLRADLIDGAPKTLRQLEAIAIADAMKRHDGNKPAVAEELGVSLKTLYNRLNALETNESLPAKSATIKIDGRQAA